MTIIETNSVIMSTRNRDRGIDMKTVDRATKEVLTRRERGRNVVEEAHGDCRVVDGDLRWEDDS